MSCHVTGDGGVDAVLDAVEAVAADSSIADRRFTLIHAYFPSTGAVQRAARLGMCVDTQGYLYYKDSDAIAEIYGKDWAARFIGVGDWLGGGVPVAVNSDPYERAGSRPRHERLQPVFAVIHHGHAQKRSGPGFTALGKSFPVSMHCGASRRWPRISASTKARKARSKPASSPIWSS